MNDNDVINHVNQMLLVVKVEQLNMLHEVRALLKEVQAERMQLLETVIKVGDAETLNAVCAMYERKFH